MNITLKSLYIMNKVIFFSIIVLIIFAGCKSKAHLQTHTPPETTEQDTIAEKQWDYASLMYPADMLYVIGREYEELSDSTSAKSQSAQGRQITAQNPTFPQYVEKRLLELYPQKAFPGIMADFDIDKLSGFAQSNNQLFMPGKGELVSISPLGPAQTEPFYQFVSLKDEAKFLNMSPKELYKYMALNELATQETFASAADFDAIRDTIPAEIPEEDKTFVMEENIFLSSLLFVTGGGYLAYRVLQSKERAVYKAHHYYGSDISCGKRGDAFKHLYVSMMLRRYLTENTAQMVMDIFWENWLINSPCDRQMDLHNNYVGRHTQYNKFRGSFLRDMYDWEKWGITIRGFVENNANSIEKQWNKGMPEYFVMKELEVTDKRKYVFWNPTSECEDAPPKP